MIRGVHMNRTHVRVWTLGGYVDFKLPRGPRPTHWTVLQATGPRPPLRNMRKAGKP